MLPAKTMAPMVARSTLEMMLDAIRQRDEQPKDLPPALPVRPTSRGRLPTSRRSLPVNLKIGAPRSLFNNSIKWEDKKEEQALRNDTDVVVKSGIFGSKRIAKLEQMEESPYSRMPELVSYEDKLPVADGSDLLDVPSSSPVVPGKKADCRSTIRRAINEVAGLEHTRNQKLQGILCVQKNFRGLQEYSRYQQLKKAAVELQSFVRGERARHNFVVLIKRWRAAVVIQKHLRQWFARTVFKDLKKDIILLQCVIRGWLVRRHFTVMKKMEVPVVSHTLLKKREMSKMIHAKLNKGPTRDPPEPIEDINNKHHQINRSVLTELEHQMLKAEAASREKEEENAILKLQLQEYEARWSKYELKMKDMEETWQKRLTSLQMNFAAARKSLSFEEMTKQRERPDPSQINHNSEDTISAGAQALEGTLAKLPNPSDSMPVRNSDSTHSAVIQLRKEFDQQKQTIDDDAGSFIGVKSGQCGANINPNEELQKLEARFASWKKVYKMQLRDTKTEVLKHGDPSEKAWRKWWCSTVSTK